MDDSNIQEWLRELERLLNGVCRLGAAQDRPEGARYIQISDTLARQLAADARRFADSMDAVVKAIVRLDSELALALRQG